MHESWICKLKRYKSGTKTIGHLVHGLPFCGPSLWTPSWTQSKDYPCGPLLIFEDEF